MSDEIKKICEVWITPETLQKHFPINCIVNCRPIDMTLDPNFPILLRPKGKVHYEVFSNNKENYDILKEKLQTEKRIKDVN